MKIVCVGHAAYDITFPLDGFVKENTKTRVDELVECGGGPACNVAYLLGKWGMKTTFLGMVGNDYYGRKIKQELESVGVDTTYLQMSDEFKTTSSFIISNKQNGSRTILTHRAKNMDMKPIDLPFKPDFILVDGQEYEQSLKIIKDNPQAVTIMDGGNLTKERLELGKKVDYLVCCHEFAESIANMPLKKENYSQVFLKMKEHFKGNIIITLESNGCLYEIDGKIKVMPSLKMKALDSTGAGDIFHGAFVYALANNFNYEDAILFSNVTAALSVTKIGGRFSIFELDEVKKKFYECR